VTEYSRPDWSTYFLNLAAAVAQRADCRRRQVGCVIVDDHNRVVSTGYNGAEPGGPSCLAGECPRGLLSYEQVSEFTDYENGPGRCHATHGEANAVLHARTSCYMTTVYITDEPCSACWKLLKSAGVKRVVWPTGQQWLKMPSRRAEYIV
jgi:dCMP deaminase